MGLSVLFLFDCLFVFEEYTTEIKTRKAVTASSEQKQGRLQNLKVVCYSKQNKQTGVHVSRKQYIIQQQALGDYVTGHAQNVWWYWAAFCPLTEHE